MRTMRLLLLSWALVILTISAFAQTIPAGPGMSYCSGSACDPSNGGYIDPYTSDFSPGGLFNVSGNSSAHMHWANFPSILHWYQCSFGNAVGSMTHGCTGRNFGNLSDGSGVAPDDYDNMPGTMICNYVTDGANGADVAWSSFFNTNGPLPDSSKAGFAVCWNKVIPVPRAWLGATVIGNLLYIVGGGTCGGCSGFGGSERGTVEAYDTVSNSWSPAYGLNTFRFGLAASVVNGKIYAFGGTNGTQSFPVAPVEMYDPALKVWTTTASLPNAAWKLTSSVVNGVIYAIGGGSGGNQCVPTGTVEAYDPVANTFTTGMSMPTPRWGAASDVINALIYVVGGSQQCPQIDVTPTAALEIYDPTGDTWTAKSPMLTARWDLAAAAVNGKLYAIGGWDPVAQKVLSTVEAYDPSTDTWTAKSSMPTARSGLAAIAINGKIYAFGGNNGTNVLATLEVYDPATDTWSTPGTTNPPSITSVSPTSGTQGQTISNFTVTGSNFDSTGAQLSFSPSDAITVTVISRTATQIVASITISATAVTGPYDVTVTNSNGQHGTSSGAFTVNAAPPPPPPPPSITSILPISGNAGQTVPITVTGSNFLPGAMLSLIGTGPVPVLSAPLVCNVPCTSATANIAIPDNSIVQFKDVVASNPGPSSSQPLKNGFRVDREFSIYDGQAGEPSIAVDPTNPAHIVVGYNDVVTGNCGWAETTDSGASPWNHGQLSFPRTFNAGASDPWVRFSPTGELFYSCVAVSQKTTRFGILPGRWVGAFIAFSTNLAGDLNTAAPVTPSVVWQSCPFFSLFCPDPKTIRPFEDHPAITPLRRGNGFRVFACWVDFFSQTGSRIKVAYSDDLSHWSNATIAGSGTLCSIGSDGSDISVPSNAQHLALTWFDTAQNLIRVASSEDGSVWPLAFSEPGGNLLPLQSVTNKVLSQPYALVAGDQSGLVVILQERLQKIGTSVREDLNTHTKTQFDVTNEAFLPGAGGNCTRIFGMYRTSTPGPTDSSSPFRYTGWALEGGTEHVVFNSGADLYGSNGFTIPGISVYHTLNEYTGADCSSLYGWVSWTDVRNGQHIWVAQIPMLQ